MLSENFKSCKRRRQNWRRRRLRYESNEGTNARALIMSKTNAKPVVVAKVSQASIVINRVVVSRNDLLSAFSVCEDEHHLVDCSHLFAAQKLVKKRKNKGKTKHKSADDLQTLTELLKGKHKKYRVYNAESDESEISDDEEKDENEESENIAALSKNIVSKIFEFNWVADSDAFSHMTDQLRLFSDSLIRIKRRIIKVEEEKLYVNYCGTAVMRNRQGNSVKLFSVLHVSKLDVNLLSGRRMCEKGLQGSFDKNGLYMHDKHGKQMIETKEHEGIYIVKRIANGLDEFALLSAMQRDASSAFPASDSSSSMNLESSSMNLDLTDTEVNQHSNSSDDKNFKAYKLWHRRFAHLESAKLRHLHKIVMRTRVKYAPSPNSLTREKMWASER